MFDWNLPLRWIGNTLFSFTATNIQVAYICTKWRPTDLSQIGKEKKISTTTQSEGLTYYPCKMKNLETIQEKWVLQCGKQEIFNFHRFRKQVLLALEEAIYILYPVLSTQFYNLSRLEILTNDLLMHGLENHPL